MISYSDILETIQMIEQENLDIRTITMGISLRDCCSDNLQSNENTAFRLSINAFPSHRLPSLPKAAAVLTFSHLPAPWTGLPRQRALISSAATPRLYTKAIPMATGG